MDFIFGLPQEDECDIQLTIKVMSDLVRMGARIHAHTFMPLPQTPFAKSPAGQVPADIKKMLRELIKKGVVFGNWVKQESIARAMESVQ